MQAPGKFNLSESRVFARWGFLGPLGTYAGAAILPGESRERTTEIRHVFLAPKDQCEIPLSFPAEMIGCLPDVIISPVPLISVSSSPRAPAPWPEDFRSIRARGHPPCPQRPRPARKMTEDRQGAEGQGFMIVSAKTALLSAVLSFYRARAKLKRYSCRRFPS